MKKLFTILAVALLGFLFTAPESEAQVINYPFGDATIHQTAHDSTVEFDNDLTIWQVDSFVFAGSNKTLKISDPGVRNGAMLYIYVEAKDTAGGNTIVFGNNLKGSNVSVAQDKEAVFIFQKSPKGILRISSQTVD